MIFWPFSAEAVRLAGCEEITLPLLFITTHAGAPAGRLAAAGFDEGFAAPGIG
jgi:hypothetical protein